MAYLAPAPFGALEPLPKAKQQVASVHSADCYICNDPDFARYGLSLCYPCPECGGHIATDDDVCDDCGYEIPTATHT